MFSFFKKNKSLSFIRSKIIAVYLDNFIKSNYGVMLNEWGNDWREKSFNDLITYFKNEIPNSKFEMIVLIISSMQDDFDGYFIYDAFSVLYKVYFDKEIPNSELNLIRMEFKNEVELRGLRKEINNYFENNSGSSPNT